MAESTPRRRLRSRPHPPTGAPYRGGDRETSPGGCNGKRLRPGVRTATPEDADSGSGGQGWLLSDFNTEFETPTPSAEEFAAPVHPIAGSGRGDRSGDGRGEPTGFAYLTMRPRPYFDGPLTHLEELYVRPHLRDRGIGTALLPFLSALGATGSGDARWRGTVHVGQAAPAAHLPPCLLIVKKYEGDFSGNPTWTTASS